MLGDGDDVSAESLSLVAIRHVKHKATLNSKVNVKTVTERSYSKKIACDGGMKFCIASSDKHHS